MEREINKHGVTFAAGKESKLELENTPLSCYPLADYAVPAADDVRFLGTGRRAVRQHPITDSLAQRQGLTGQAYWKLYAQVDFAVRKTAHFLEYTLLGMLLTLLLDSYRARWHWLSWAGCTLYAATDEIHQLFVAGRTGKWQDVLLDSSGALAGLLLAMFMLWLIRRRRAKKQST